MRASSACGRAARDVPDHGGQVLSPGVGGRRAPHPLRRRPSASAHRAFRREPVGPSGPFHVGRPYNERSGPSASGHGVVVSRGHGRPPWATESDWELTGGASGARSPQPQPAWLARWAVRGSNTRPPACKDGVGVLTRSRPFALPAWLQGLRYGVPNPSERERTLGVTTVPTRGFICPASFWPEPLLRR
jgi:hypothetical protein